MSFYLRNIIYLLVPLLFLAGCGQYPEGPDFTFLSKKQRLTGKWKLIAGSLYDPDEVLYFEFCKDGKFSWEHTVPEKTQSGEGTWEWSENKFKVSVMLSNSVVEYSIQKLKKKELKITDEDFGKGSSPGYVWEFVKE